MSIKSLNPYLNFDGTAAQAIALYQRALGATAEGQVMRFSDVPDYNVPPEQKDRIMHAHLRVGGGALMISDGRAGQPPRQGDAVQVALHYDNVADMAKHFNALAEGGTVTMPLADTFWGATFGMLIDAFGVHWMFNCPKQA
jgi:PhnB protein